MVWMIYDGHVITRDECGLNLLTFVFVFRLRENPGKNLNEDIENLIIREMPSVG